MTEQSCPGYTGEEHPEFFSNIPPQPKESKPGQLTEDQVKQFYEEGFLVLENFFTRSELDPCREAVNTLVDNLANKLFSAGKIKDTYSDHGFKDRMTLIERDFPGANILLHKQRNQHPQAVNALGSNERILNVMEQLLGTGDIAAYLVWLLRAKTPGAEEGAVPWHQDSAFFHPSTYKNVIITGWVPLVDANVENGCLQVVRKAHKKGKIAKHVGCWKNTWYVQLTDDEIRKTLNVDPDTDTVTCPVPYGGILLLSNFSPHRSLPNTTDAIRWSYDLRWQAAQYSPPHKLLRSSTDPNFRVNWDEFSGTLINQRDPFREEFYTNTHEFDTIAAGPWMFQWPIIHENRHTALLKHANREEWQKKLFG